MPAKPKATDIDAIVKKVENTDLTEFEAWPALDGLSSNTRIDGIEVDPAGITVEGHDFKGVANVYVVLFYGDGDKESFTATDGVLGKFSGHLEGSKPVIDQFTVDTSPFFESQ
jgi:hypothetical protein